MLRMKALACARAVFCKRLRFCEPSEPPRCRLQARYSRLRSKIPQRQQAWRQAPILKKHDKKPDCGRAFCRGQIVSPNTTPAKKLLIRQIAPLSATVKRQRNYACRAQKNAVPCTVSTIIVKESELHSSQRQQKRPCKCAAKRSGDTAARGKSCKSPPFCCERPINYVVRRNAHATLIRTSAHGLSCRAAKRLRSEGSTALDRKNFACYLQLSFPQKKIAVVPGPQWQDKIEPMGEMRISFRRGKVSFARSATACAVCGHHACATYSVLS